MQPGDDLGAQLAQLDAIYRSGQPRTVAEIDAILGQLNTMASRTRSELSGDEQSTVARVDELRHLYTGWYNEAVKAQDPEPSGG